MKFTVAAVSAFLAMCVGPPLAQADVIYNFVTTSFGDTDPAKPGGPLLLTLDLSDAVVRSGSFTLMGGSFSTGYFPALTGDVGGFTSITTESAYAGLETITPNYLFGHIDLKFTFAANGGVTSSAFEFLGNTSEADISGTGSTASGFLGSDSGQCDSYTAAKKCSVAGYFTQVSVPEPASLVMLAGGIVGFGLARGGVPSRGLRRRRG